VKAASVSGCVLAGVSLCLSAHSARAQESPLGLYVGVGAGSATLRQEPEPDTGYYGLSRDDIGWDAFIGVRPLPYLGAEIGYTDFGSVSRHTLNFDFVSATETSEVFGHAAARAPTAFAVGYLPLAVAWFDVYGKLGAARLYKSWSFVSTTSFEEPPIAGTATYVGSATEWDFAWGIGTEWKFGALALRLEYQRVDASGGDPDMLSAGLTWTLF
jgi:OmpA-like transmembrane domain